MSSTRIGPEGISGVLAGLASSDAQTRGMARLFVASCAMVGVTLLAGLYYFLTPDPTVPRELTAVEKDAKTIGDFVQKQIDQTRTRATFLPIGTFTLELKPVPGMRAAKGVLNMAEVEMFIQCDTLQTRDYLFTNQTRLKDRVTRALPVIEREELLTREGKKKLKTRLVRSLNEWLTSQRQPGQIQDIFFSKLMIN